MAPAGLNVKDAGTQAAGFQELGERNHKAEQHDNGAEAKGVLCGGWMQRRTVEGEQRNAATLTHLFLRAVSSIKDTLAREQTHARSLQASQSKDAQCSITKDT